MFKARALFSEEKRELTNKAEIKRVSSPANVAVDNSDPKRVATGFSEKIADNKDTKRTKKIDSDNKLLGNLKVSLFKRLMDHKIKTKKVIAKKIPIFKFPKK